MTTIFNNTDTFFEVVNFVAIYLGVVVITGKGFV